MVVTIIIMLFIHSQPDSNQQPMFTRQVLYHLTIRVIYGCGGTPVLAPMGPIRVTVHVSMWATVGGATD